MINLKKPENIAIDMYLINNHINGKTKCERLQIEHGRIPQRTCILVSATTTKNVVSFKR